MAKPHRNRRFLFVVIALPALALNASCRQGIVPANAIMHPTSENLLRTYMVDQETGNGGLVSDSLPRIARAWTLCKTFRSDSSSGNGEAHNLARMTGERNRTWLRG